MTASFLIPIADHIRETCRKGFDIDASTWHFLESTLFNPTPALIAAILNEAGDSESDTVIELVFYPVESMQLSLEPLIESTRLTHQDIKSLMALVNASPLIVPLFFKALNANITIELAT